MTQAELELEPVHLYLKGISNNLSSAKLNVIQDSEMLPNRDQVSANGCGSMEIAPHLLNQKLHKAKKGFCSQNLHIFLKVITSD